jgi:hypothetical protein
MTAECIKIANVSLFFPIPEEKQFRTTNKNSIKQILITSKGRDGEKRKKNSLSRNNDTIQTKKNTVRRNTSSRG